MTNTKTGILDDDFLDLAAIKQKLAKAGLHNVYETENNSLLVSENDAVRVEVQIVNNAIVTDKKFPQIGNTIQIIVTAIFAILAFAFDLPFKWLLAIGIGQAVSYFFHTPKINKLEAQINSSFGE
jgi:hypothetical protein